MSTSASFLPEGSRTSEAAEANEFRICMWMINTNQDTLEFLIIPQTVHCIQITYFIIKLSFI